MHTYIYGIITIVAVVTLLYVGVIYIWDTPRYLQCKVLDTIDSPEMPYIIEIVNNECQEGLPHTTDTKTVRMTRAVYDSARRDKILRHERVHLAQKANYATWYDFYKDAWGYECFSTPPQGIPHYIQKLIRPNPDTSDTPWVVWKQRWVFFPMFGADRTLMHATVAIWDLKKHKLVDAPNEWKTQFCGNYSGCPIQYEHPHEISAEWLTDSSDAPAAQKLKYIKFYRNE